MGVNSEAEARRRRHTGHSSPHALLSSDQGFFCRSNRPKTIPPCPDSPQDLTIWGYNTTNFLLRSRDLYNASHLKAKTTVAGKLRRRIEVMLDPRRAQFLASTALRWPVVMDGPNPMYRRRYSCRRCAEGWENICCVGAGEIHSDESEAEIISV